MLTEDTAARLNALPRPERIRICTKAALKARDESVRWHLLDLATAPVPEDYEHLMSCKDPHCGRCA